MFSYIIKYFIDQGKSIRGVGIFMDVHIKEFYRQFSESSSNGHFHRVISLHEIKEISWSQVCELVPTINRGWYELSRLESKDRIAFSHDFWITKMPFHPKLDGLLINFFNSLDDIGIFITQKMFDSPYEAHLVYSLENDSGFFHGEQGATEKQLLELQKQFPENILPDDYLAFLQIHNGFGKSTDTGIIPSYLMNESYKKLQKMLNEHESLINYEAKTINPKALIPFYESFGLPCFQCFFDEWHPAQEMGNIYYSGLTHTISSCTGSESSPENLAFATFTDWLMFYLEPLQNL